MNVNNTIRKYIYIDKGDKRLFRLMIVSILSLFVVALTTPYEANAETGTLTIDAGAGNSYTVPASFTGGTYSFDKIEFFSSGYNKIASINYTYSQLTFSNQTNTTQFHFISGATGSGGTVTYNSVSKSITWYFADDTIVTSSEIVLSYNSNIFTGVGCGFCQYEDSQSLSSSQPAYVRSDAVSKPDRRATGSYIVQSSTLFSNSYNVTYTSVSQGILANVAISKSGATVASKINILNSTNSKFQETSFNTADFSYSFIYDTGIALNMTDSQGDFDFVVVNSTAYTGPGITPTPTPTPTINPDTGAGIIFDKSIYHVNDFGTISTVVDNTGFLTLVGIDSFRVDFFSSKRPLISQFDIDLSQSTQQFSVLFSQEDSYTAILVEHNNIFGTDTILATATAQAIKGTSFVQVNSSVPVGISTPVTVQFGVTPCALNDGLLVKFLNPVDGLYYKESSFVLSAINTTVLAGVPYTFGVSFNQEGTYLLQLYDFCSDNDGILASATTKSVLTAGNITNNITVSDISINNQNYSFGDTMSGHYIIDSFNYSHYNVYLDNFNFNFGYNTMMQPLSKQERDFYGTLVTSDASCFAGDCVIYSGQIPTDIGLNRIRLLARNATSTFEIVGVNYTVSNINNQGYGLTVSKTTVCPNEFFFINATIPSPSLIVIQDKAGTTFKSYNISNSTAFPISLSTTGNYEIQITDLSHNVQMQRIMNVTACATPTATPITGGGAATDVTNLLSSNIFWAFILTFGMMASVAILTKGYNSEIPVAITGVLGISAFSTIGWMPWWLTFSVIILIFVVFAWQQSKNLNVGTGK